MFEGLVQDRIGGWRRLTELDFRLVDSRRGLEPLLVERRTRRGEVAGGREPQPRAVGQFHQLLRGGTANRAFADEVGALIARERGREDFRRA